MCFKAAKKLFASLFAKPDYSPIRQQVTARFFTTTQPNHADKPRRIFYYDWGKNNRDVIVCVHGLSRNARDFDFLATALSRKARVICIDMAGRGRSEWLTDKSAYNYATYVADITALLDSLKLNSITWIGTSMGGIIGMMMAASQPQRMKRMVLNDIGKIVSAEGLRRILGQVGSQSEFGSKDEAMAYLRSALATFGITSEAHWHYMFDISFKALPDGRYQIAYDPTISQPFKEAASKEGEIKDVDLTALWNAVQCPVLILRGAESDILARDVATSMCTRYLPTKLVECDGVGHAPALLDDVQIRTITDWLDNKN